MVDALKAPMELRYLGFDQEQNTRAYRFEGLTKGEPTIVLIVTADMALFLKHRIGIQEGPSMCVHKLASDTQTPRPANLEITNEDLRVLAEARIAAVNRKAALRRNGTPRHYPRRSAKVTHFCSFKLTHTKNTI
jgi:hypothetical protein